MRCRSCILLLSLLLGSPVLAQGVAPEGNGLRPSVAAPAFAFGEGGSNDVSPVLASGDHWASSEGEGPLASNRKFPNFIGWMSNPLSNIDPRALTQVVPIFASAWVSHGAALPDLDVQVYGPAISLALTDRLCVGLNQGGYAFAHVDRNDPRRPLLNRALRNRGVEFGGTREGFLNVGGFAQYTLIEDVENQFLATAGVRLIAPAGSYELFQGKGPAQMAPYATVGKEFGDFHLLMTGGYQFPLRSGDRQTELVYLNAHLDRQFFGWVYPLMEANWTNHTTSVPVDLPARRGFFDFGNFESTGNVVTLACGVNLVLIRDRLEFGGVYVRSVGTQRDVDIDALIVKMVLRY